MPCCGGSPAGDGEQRQGSLKTLGLTKSGLPGVARADQVID